VTHTDHFLGDGTQIVWKLEHPITKIVEFRTRGIHRIVVMLGEQTIEITPPLLFNVEAELEYEGDGSGAVGR
jgi:hypothetical protein